MEFEESQVQSLLLRVASEKEASVASDFLERRLLSDPEVRRMYQAAKSDKGYVEELKKWVLSHKMDVLRGIPSILKGNFEEFFQKHQDFPRPPALGMDKQAASTSAKIAMVLAALLLSAQLSWAGTADSSGDSSSKAKSEQTMDGPTSYNLDIDKNLDKTFGSLEKAFDTDAVTDLFDGKTDIDFNNLTDAGIYKMIDASMVDAMKIQEVKSALANILQGTTDGSEVSPKALKSIAGKMHPILMEKLQEDAGFNPIKKAALMAVSGKVKTQLEKWLLNGTNVQKAVDASLLKQARR